jgi:hypothetical protein
LQNTEISRIGIKQLPLTDLYVYLIQSSWPFFFGVFAILVTSCNLIFGLFYFIDQGLVFFAFTIKELEIQMDPLRIHSSLGMQFSRI